MNSTPGRRFVDRIHAEDWPIVHACWAWYLFVLFWMRVVTLVSL